MVMNTLSNLVVLAQRRTRGHEVTLVKEQYRLDIGKYSFSQKMLNEWNKLSTDCDNANGGLFWK